MSTSMLNVFCVVSQPKRCLVYSATQTCINHASECEWACVASAILCYVTVQGFYLTLTYIVVMDRGRLENFFFSWKLQGTLEEPRQWLNGLCLRSQRPG